MAKLLTEFLTEGIVFEEKMDEATNEKQLYLVGPLMQHSTLNKNNRLYPESLVMREFERFNEQMIKPCSALMELSHPNHLEINPDRACARIIEAWPGENNTIMGKCLILDTDTGRNLRGLIKGGTRIGFSTRSSGELKEKNGINEVTNFSLRTVDIVLEPSIGLFSNAVNESKNFIFENNRFIEVEDPQKTTKLKEENALKLFEQFLKGKI